MRRRGAACPRGKAYAQNGPPPVSTDTGKRCGRSHARGEHACLRYRPHRACASAPRAGGEHRCLDVRFCQVLPSASRAGRLFVPQQPLGATHPPATTPSAPQGPVGTNCAPGGPVRLGPAPHPDCTTNTTKRISGGVARGAWHWRILPHCQFVPVFHAHCPCVEVPRGQTSGGISRGEGRGHRGPRPGLSTKPSRPCARNRCTHL